MNRPQLSPTQASKQKAADLQKSNATFHSIINNLEMEHSYYFCLISVQKGLDKVESIYDHFCLDTVTGEFRFKIGSDLPMALRESILHTYQSVYA